jgi:hypothetical protein
MVTGRDKGEGLIIRLPTSVDDARDAKVPGLGEFSFALSSGFEECEEEGVEVDEVDEMDAAAAGTVGAGALRLADCWNYPC